MNRMMNQHFMKCVTCENFPCPFVAEMFPHLIDEVAMQKADERKAFVDELEHQRDMLWVRNRGFEEDPNIVMVIKECESIDFFKKEDLEEEMPFTFFGYAEVVMDGTVIVLFDEDDVIEFGDVKYLMGPAVIQGIDKYGNECSVSREDIENALDYLEMSVVDITVDGKSYQALRLV